MTKNRKFITLKALEKSGACSSGLRRFEEVFGKSAKLSEKNVMKAVDANLSVLWLIYFLHNDSYKKYYKLECPIWNDFYQKTDDIYVNFVKDRDKLFSDFKNHQIKTFEEYMELRHSRGDKFVNDVRGYKHERDIKLGSVLIELLRGDES